MWMLPLRKVVQDMMQHQAFAEHVCTARDAPGSWFGSEGFQKVDEKCLGALSEEHPAIRTLVMCMFHDGGRLKSKGCSTMVYAMKCADLPPHMSHTKEAYLVFAVVEGEDEPLIVRAITRSIIDELVMYCPVAGGVSASYTLQLALHA
jgi:hypothetical protein